MSWRSVTGGLLAVVATAGLSACGSRSEDGGGSSGGSPGVTDTTIKLGSSASYSGPVAAYATLTRSMEAYFKHVNEDEGGVKMADGKRRKIEFTAYDDGFDPARATANARRLVEQDEVFGLVGTLGTDPSVAMMDYLNKREVPQAFVVTQSTNFGVDAAKHPWSIGFMPTIASESGVFAGDLRKHGISGDAVAIFPNDAGGKNHLSGLQAALGDGPVRLAKSESFQESDPTVNPQIAALQRTGSKVFFDLAPPKFAAQAIKRTHELGWTPRHYLPSQSNSIEATLKPAGLDKAKGVYSVAWLKDPNDPKWKDDPEVPKYRGVLRKYGQNLSADDMISVQGYVQGEVVVRALEQAQPTRRSFMDSVRNLRGLQLSMVLPGIEVNTGPDDAFPIESLYLEQFDGKRWVVEDEPVDLEGKTPKVHEK
ncbi:ABC transporter substrate-binding protein [Patulibacter defluvii]|uniref:ABC transporter substrate-binding protein n=1 Tax=Patulibacter defluvii TaxID=3095358 RepID=UPI002A749D35|nr:ABC transporter substrate-binding protein [Patulibacter sp. DM4]